MEILYAVLVLGGLGLLFGLVLSFASRVFAVKTDARLDELMQVLPGANCGGCGYAGCSSFAKALLEGKAPSGGCPVGGVALSEKVATILGIEAAKNTRLTALVKCSGGVRASRKYEYKGLTDCHAAMKTGGGGPLECAFGCIGLGSCVRSCPFGAISLVEGVAVVDHERCTGCLKCVSECPKNIIVPVPYYADVNVACSSHDRGGSLRKICEIGCIGCKICEKTCKHDAIHVVDNLAVIDFDNCTGCGDCAEKCPRKLIVDSKLDRGPRVLSEEA